MSQIDPELDEYEDEDDDGQGGNRDWRRAREANKRLKEELAAERASSLEAKKRLAFLDAKLPESPQVKFFQQHYAGDLSPDAIRAAATESGFLTDTSAEEVDAIDSITDMTGAGRPPAAGTDAAMMDEIKAVKGMNAPQQIEDIYRRYGVSTGQQ